MVVRRYRNENGEIFESNVEPNDGVEIEKESVDPLALVHSGARDQTRMPPYPDLVEALRAQRAGDLSKIAKFFDVLDTREK
jgi:hypothetical protein